jgi:hypothetical protein
VLRGLTSLYQRRRDINKVWFDNWLSQRHRGWEFDVGCPCCGPDGRMWETRADEENGILITHYRCQDCQDVLILRSNERGQLLAPPERIEPDPERCQDWAWRYDRAFARRKD